MYIKAKLSCSISAAWRLTGLCPCDSFKFSSADEGELQSELERKQLRLKIHELCDGQKFNSAAQLSLVHNAAALP